MKRIERLTPEQESLLQDRYQDWLEVGRSCEPIDVPEARAVVNDFYKRVGKPEPTIFVFSSPVMCVMGWAALRTLTESGHSQLRSQLDSQLRSQLRSQLWSQLDSQLRSQLRSQLDSQLDSQLRSQLRSQLDSQLWSQLRSQLDSQLWSQLDSQLDSQLRSQLRSQLDSQLWSQLRSQLDSQLWSQLRNYFPGQHACAWEVYYKFCQEIGVKYLDEHLDLLNLWLRQSKALHWWFPYDGIVLLSERHNALRIDDSGRLHSESSIACGYMDGWGVWALNGVIVDEQIILRPESQTLDQIKQEKNEEVRRIRIERFGWDRYLRDVGAKPRDRRRNDRDAQVEELFRLDDGTQRFLCIDPSTGRKYALGVPREIATCEQAQNWMSHGLDLYASHRS